MSKMISVSDELKEDLDNQKEQEGHTSHDSLIRLMKAESAMYRLIKDEYESLKKKLEECEKQKPSKNTNKR